ncbi:MULTISPECIES: ABC transporter ATP-binding protein [unclassified Rhizobium]|uniref:ABC transporter ATP-binding protein n=1 Tax=unclassified Rhizobium TaxID=2613769 RepID=UPI001ADAD46D|nr:MULTISPECIES: ABC transporter ATP-binding protein [unclassified Rhizobium]MBO9126368.1 ABC transporter ATP-binding protein [Rhizobium sp. 16-488-2b]MBO9178102.1 ABC transporter ATP-binding protein [Rhizobium sp. 16-488-2a]
MAQVKLNNLIKNYGSYQAVVDVSLTVEDGEFVALVGPSGCGKTTTLNLVAGLAELTSGEIQIGSTVVTDLDPKDRDIAMVFQNYALYPNKSVYENLAFPLKMRKVPKAEIVSKIASAAKVLDIEHLLERRPRELSGGQQQRVALGRALVRDPKVFLMDEPLSNLDAKLRVQMRTELKRFHTELNATVIYVTHDQLEAMTMADKMAIMNRGILQQFDTPAAVFDNPANTFVAGFVGSPAMNLMNAQITSIEGTIVLKGDDGWHLQLSEENNSKASNATGHKVVVGIRHNGIQISPEPDKNAMAARVFAVEPTGDITYVHLRVGTSPIIASVSSDVHFDANQDVWITFNQRKVYLFDGETTRAL